MAIRRNIIANYAGQLWTAVMGLVFVPVYIRFLGMEAYGLIGVFALLQTWLSLLDFGLTPTLTREMAKKVSDEVGAQSLRDLLRSVEFTVGVIAMAVAVILWQASPWIANYWLNPQHIPISTVASACALMGLVMALRGIENVYRGSVIGLERQVSLNIAICAFATVRSVGALAVLSFISPSIVAFFVWQAIVSLATVAVLAMIVYRALPKGTGGARFSLQSLRLVGRFSAGTFGISLLGFALSQTDKIVLSRALPLGEFGTYSLAATLAAYVRLLATSIDQAVYPRFVSLYASGEHGDLARFYHQSTQLSAVLMGGAGVAIAMFGRPFLTAWTHDAALAEHVSPLLALLTLGMVANGLLNGPYYLQMAAGWTSLLLKSNLVMVIVFIPLVIWSVTSYGSLGAAAMWAATNFVYLAVVVSLMHRRLLPGEQRRWYIEDILFPLGAATAAGGAFRLMAPVSATPFTSGLVFLGGSAITLGAAAAGSSYVRQSFRAFVGRAASV